MKKSVELPINFMIILAIAVIAGVVFLLFFFGVARGTEGSLWTLKRDISDVLIENVTREISPVT